MPAQTRSALGAALLGSAALTAARVVVIGVDPFAVGTVLSAVLAVVGLVVLASARASVSIVVVSGALALGMGVGGALGALERRAADVTADRIATAERAAAAARQREGAPLTVLVARCEAAALERERTEPTRGPLPAARTAFVERLTICVLSDPLARARDVTCSATACRMPVATPDLRAGVRDQAPVWTATFTDALNSWLAPRRDALADGSYDSRYG